MDEHDRKILEVLMEHGRTTWADLAATVGLSPPSTAERVRKLEDRGVIRGYRTHVDPDSLGFPLLAFVSVSSADPDGHEALLSWAAETAEVQECHIVAGDYDYLLKVRCRGTRHLERLLRKGVRSLPGVAKTHSTVVLATHEESASFPVPEAG